MQTRNAKPAYAKLHESAIKVICAKEVRIPPRVANYPVIADVCRKVSFLALALSLSLHSVLLSAQGMLPLLEKFALI